MATRRVFGLLNGITFRNQQMFRSEPLSLANVADS